VQNRTEIAAPLISGQANVTQRDRLSRELWTDSRGSGVVVNRGSLGGGEVGVLAKSGGAVTNQSAAIITGSTAVAISGGSGVVVNQGSVGGGVLGVGEIAGGAITNQSAAIITGSATAVYIAGGNGAVVNQGSIGGGQFGVRANSGGAVTNQSAAIITGYTAAVTIAGGSANVVNDGTILGKRAAVVVSNGTVVNAGSIIANGLNPVAVAFTNGSPTTARLIADPGAYFYGFIAGGTGVMELAAGANAGTLQGFGFGVTNFSSLVFDPNAFWTVKGNDAASGLGTLAIDGFAAGDTIDLTGFIATGESFATNTLTLTNASVAQPTLAIQGGFSSSDFHISGDGGTGTDIFLGPAPPPPSPAIATIGVADAVNVVNLTITGTTAAGTTVALTFGAEAPAAATVNGTTWSYTLTATDIAALGQGLEKTFLATATNANGTSAPASSLDFSVDTVAPTAPVITSPATTDIAAPVITGTAEAGDTVTVTVAGATYTTMATDGAWSIDLGDAVPDDGSLALNDNGTNSVTASATDPAGNISILGTQTLTIGPMAAAGPSATPVTGLVAIINTVPNQAVPNETPIQPFATVSVVDPAVNASDTITVTLSAPGNGTLSNLSGGSYNVSTGVYRVTGTPAVTTAALRTLVFTPIAQPNTDVTTTDFAIDPGSGGAVDTTTSVTSVQQIYGLATVPLNQIVISASPDGGAFAAPQPGMTNEAVVIAPAEGGSYTVPTGYQAEFLGGTADATLTDAVAGNALLAANSGNDRLVANAPNDVLVAGSGGDSLFGGSYANTVAGGSGSATVFGGTGATQAIGRAGSLQLIGGMGASTVFGGTGAASVAAGPGGAVVAVDAGMNATVNGSSGTATVFGAAGATVDLVGSGGEDFLIAGSGNETINASGASSPDWLSVSSMVTSSAAVLIAGSGNDTLIAGSAAGATTMTGGSGHDAFVFFRQAAGGAHDVITNFATNDAVYIEGYATSGSASALQAAATVGSAGLTFTLSDGTTITFSNLTNASALNGAIQYG
jgi:hypothetical protein